MSRLILIEGIPGSGKTTYALRLAKHYKQYRQPVECYIEGKRNPVDLAWCAVLDEDEYIGLLSDYPEYSKKIQEYSFREAGMIIVPYTELNIIGKHKPLWDYLEQKEIFNGRYSITDFLQINVCRWENFATEHSSEETVIIFESVFMQNHINEIILFHEHDYDMIYNYIKSLYLTVKDLNPLLIYLDQSDIRKTILDTAAKRKSRKTGFPDWIDSISQYIENTPFGSNSKNTGIECMIEFFKVRKTIENRLFMELDISKLLIEDSSCDYEKGFSKIISLL